MPDPRLTELEQVEEPFLRQLEGLGWRVLRGDKYDPASTERESFHEVIIEAELRAALKQINPWLEDDQIDELIRRIQAPLSTQPLKANEEILGLLLEGQSVSGNRQTREGHPNARYLILVIVQIIAFWQSRSSRSKSLVPRSTFFPTLSCSSMDYRWLWWNVSHL
jgi:type I site-specific restriction-modification system R (restriction) subunit